MGDRVLSHPAFGQEGPVTGNNLVAVRQWTLGVISRGAQKEDYQLYQMPQDGQWIPLGASGPTTSILPLAPGRGLLLVQSAQLAWLDAGASTARVLEGLPAQVSLKELLAWRVPEPVSGAQPTLDTLIVLATGRQGAAQVDTLLELRLVSGRVTGAEPAPSGPDLLNRDLFFARWTAFRCKKQAPVSECLTAVNSKVSCDQRRLGGQRSIVRLKNLKGSYDFLDATWVPGSANADLYLLARPTK